MFSAFLRVLRQLEDLARTSTFVHLLIGVWLIYAFQSYLPALVGNRLDRILRHTGAYDVLLILWFIAVAYCAGKRLLRLLGVSAAPGAEQAAFSIAIGAAAFSLAATILALVHGLYRPVAYALLLVPTFIWRDEMAELFRGFRQDVTATIKKLTWSARSLGYGLAGIYIAVVLAVVLLSALAPSFDYDDLMYHLAGPKNFVVRHALVPLFDVPNTLFPKNIEMLYTLALLWHCDVAAKLVHFMLGILTMLSVYAFAARFLSRAVGVVAVAVLVSSHLFVWEMRTAHNDVGMAAFVFAGAYAVALWLWNHEAAWLRLAICLLAFSLGIKYWTILAVGVIVLLVFAVQLYRTRALTAAAKLTGKMAPIGFGFLPWSLVSLYYTGNPFFPLLNNVFRSPYWSSVQTDLALRQINSGGIPIIAFRGWELIGLWWSIMVDPGGTSRGNIGPFYVMLLPLLLLRSRIGPASWFVFASSALYYVGWVASGPHLRYLLPALPGFALAAACGALSWLRLLQSMHRFLAVAGAALLVAFAFLSTPFFEGYGASARYGYGLIDTLPIKCLTGTESKGEYLSRNHPGYPAVQFINQRPGPKKVYFIHAIPDGYYLDGQPSYFYSAFSNRLRDQNADGAHRVLREHGITHVIVQQVSIPFDPLGSREHEFTRRYLFKLYQRNAHIAYELLPGAVDQDSVEVDFLEHLGEAHAKGNRPARRVCGISDDVRLAMVTTPPSEVEFQVNLGGSSRLSFAVGRSNPACMGMGAFEVLVQPEGQGRHTVYRHELVGEMGAGWFEDHVDLSEYNWKRITIAFRTEDPSKCCDYFWADPALIVRTSDSPILGTYRSHGSDPPIEVSGGRARPARLRVGGSYELKFLGRELPEDAYIDVRFRAPGASAEQVVFNWQRGPLSRHTVDPQTRSGKWIISGVRAHRDARDHSGEFSPVSIVLNISP